MVNWIKRRIKRFSIKFLMWEKGTKFLKPEGEKTEYEKLCLSICRKLISHSDSKFSIAPISDKRYIINEKLAMFVVFQQNTVEITNHVYHYVVKLDNRDANRLHHMYNHKTETIRLAYEEKIKAQITNSLQKIFDKVSKS
jgi:hypothetical protein